MRLLDWNIRCVVVAAMIVVHAQHSYFLMSHAFLLPLHHHTHHKATTKQSSIRKQWNHHHPRLGMLPDNYQEVGNKLIYTAASACGVDKDCLDIQWKAGKLYVEVQAESAYVSNPDFDTVDYPQLDEPLVFPADLDSGIDDLSATGVDVSVLARAINVAFDDEGVGLAIAEVHEIEVSTPGASDELRGIMFEAYRGFDVVLQQKDLKKNKIKTIEGRLVERNEEFTILNLKGRMKKVKNIEVVSVKLPKAKKEKGTKKK